MNIKVGNLLNLTFKSKKGKEHLKRGGTDAWKVHDVKESVQFSDMKGPWLLIQKTNPNTGRWIHQHNDDDFDITMVI